MKVLGLGNALVDIMTQLSSDSALADLGLRKGSMQIVDDAFMQKALEYTRNMPQSLAAGGSAANAIHGLANLGIETAFIGKIGNDSFGSRFEQDMRSSGIEPIMLRGKAQSGRALALVSPDSERTFATYLGAAVEMVPTDITPDMFRGYGYFHIEGYLVQNHALVRRAVEIAHEQGLTISLDLASFNVVEDNLDFLTEIVERYVNIVFANEEEAKAFTGKSPETSLDVLAEMTDIAVVKLGAKGSLVKRGSEFAKVGIIDASCVDTTGAGDLYAAGFLFGLINNLPLERCGYIGAVLSGHVIEVLGPKMDAQRWQKVRKLVDEK